MPKTWFIGGGWRLPKRGTRAARRRGIRPAAPGNVGITKSALAETLRSEGGVHGNEHQQTPNAAPCTGQRVRCRFRQVRNCRNEDSEDRASRAAHWTARNLFRADSVDGRADRCLVLSLGAAMRPPEQAANQQKRNDRKTGARKSGITPKAGRARSSSAAREGSSIPDQQEHLEFERIYTPAERDQLNLRAPARMFGYLPTP
jgi:hypothetical protein